MDIPQASNHAGYDIDLHYDEDGAEWYCSAWLDGKGIHSEPSEAKSCCEYSGAGTKVEAIAKACEWLEKYIL